MKQRLRNTRPSLLLSSCVLVVLGTTRGSSCQARGGRLSEGREQDMTQTPSPLARAEAFCARFGIRLPILLAPMAGACPPALSIAVANAGGLGGCGALLMQPKEIEAWAAAVRAKTNGGFQLNLWMPDPAPQRDPAAEQAMREFLAHWGPPVPAEAGEIVLPDFAAQCDALLEVRPAAISSMMGLYPAPFVQRMKALGIPWFANATTVSE